MDSRKIIAFGTNSFVISLPKNWLDKNKLLKGDAINVNELDNELILSSNELIDVPTENITINIVDENISILRTELVTAYLKGYDNITIKGDLFNQMLPEIRFVISLLPGLEIMHLTSNNINVKNLLNEKNVIVDEIIIRVDSMLKSILSDSVKCTNDSLANSITERDKDINRMVYLSFRVMRKALKNRSFALEVNLNPQKIMTFWQILQKMELIGDQSKRIAKYLSQAKLSNKKLKEIKEIFKILEQTYSKLIKAYEDKDLKYPLKIAANSKEEIIDRCFESLKVNPTYEELRIIENLQDMAISIERIAQTLIARD